MADKQKVLITLTLLSETCSAALSSLEESPTSNNAPEHPLTVIRKDYLSLLTLVYTSSTKLSLTLRPSEPAYSASLTPISDLANHIFSLTTCATLHDSHGLTLAQDVRVYTKQVCEAVSALAQVFVSINAGHKPEASSSTSTAVGEDYLVRTGAIHEIIEKIRKDLPEDNLGAVRKRWAQDRAMLEDSLNEITEMIDGGGQDDDEDEGFGDDVDEWDELGLGITKKMSAVEMERTKQVQPLFRISVLLHKRILLDLFLKQSDTNKVSSAAMDIMPEHSHAVLLAAEELVAVLYAPQDPMAVSSAVTSLADSISVIQEALLKLALYPATQKPPEDVDTLRNKLIETSIGGAAKAQARTRDIRKWFDTCFEQIPKVSKSITDSLVTVSNAK